ncbi:hypothetical protein HN51_029947, partial [Arachis hypogaea]
SMIIFAIPIKFALLFTLENILAVKSSTAFVLGPTQQLEIMFDAARIFTTTIYIIKCV